MGKTWSELTGYSSEPPEPLSDVDLDRLCWRLNLESYHELLRLNALGCLNPAAVRRLLEQDVIVEGSTIETSMD